MDEGADVVAAFVVAAACAAASPVVGSEAVPSEAASADWGMLTSSDRTNGNPAGVTLTTVLLRSQSMQRKLVTHVDRCILRVCVVLL